VSVPPITALGRRSPPGQRWTFSAFAWDLGPLSEVRGDADRLPSVGFLRRSRDLGVTTFDLGRSRTPALAETRLGEAFPEPDPELVTILPFPQAPPGPWITGAATPVRADELQPALLAARRRLRGAGRIVLEWRAPPATVAPGTLPAIDFLALQKEGLLLEVAEATDRPPGEGNDRLRTGVISLLDTRLPRAIGASAPEGAAWIARDPFAGGRLDGSAFGRLMTGPPRQGPPRPVRTLEAEFATVRPLGFLTAGTGRTLAQAALRFALAWPWVVSVSVPVPPPERLAEIAGTAEAPPLTETELARVLALEGANVGARREPS
jgi:hypothetical protein